MKEKDALNVEKRLERLRGENRSLRQRLSSLRKENRQLSKSLIKKDGLLNSMPGGLVVISQGKIQDVNKKALETLEYTAEEVLGRDFLDLVHPESRARLWDLHQRRVDGKPVPNRYETVLMTKAGQGIHCDVAVEKILWEGRMAFLARVSRLEGRKSRERDLIRQGKRELLTTMASGMLGGLEGNAREIQACLRKAQAVKGSEARVRREDLQRVSEAVGRLGGLIRTLDSLSREGYASGRATLVDLRGVVQDTIAPVEAELAKKAARDGVTINLKTYLRPVSPLEGDPEELREAVMGLIENAVAAMPMGGDLHLSVEESAGNAYVYIQDSGTGIPEPVMDRVIDPFFTTKGNEARGLGLSLASAVLKRHGGDLEIESRKEKGTTVALRIPLRKKASQENGKPNRRSRKNVGILILEEDPMIRELFFQVLSGKGYRVVTGEDLPSGLEKLRARTFDLVIVGSGSDELQGVDLVRRVRRIDPETRLALVVGEGGENFPGLLDTDRVDLHIRKPIDMTWVVNRIAEFPAKARRK